MTTQQSRRTFLKTATALTISTLSAPYILKASAQSGSQNLRVRKNASLMQPSDPFFNDYAEAIRAMHETNFPEFNAWREQSLTHLDHCPHGRPDFVAWHRHYITAYETMCGELIGKSDFALAYWDWTANSGRLPAPFFADAPLNVTFWNDPSNAQSDNWGPATVSTVGTRRINVNTGLQDDPQRGGAFTTQNIASIQRLPSFNLFQSRLEGSPHNNGHVITGGGNGHMGDGMSPLDPAFWMHHCNVDRIWAEWQAAGNTTPDLDRNYSGQFLLVDGSRSTGQTANNARDFEAMGFTYDTLAETLVGMNTLLNFPTESEQSILASIPAAAPQTIGSLAATATVRPFIATDLDVTAPDLVTNLFAPRTFRPMGEFSEKRLAVGQGRILAKLSDVKANGAVNKVVTNVFVNCPYLSPETPFNDPHYADTFSFFMPAGKDGMGHGREFVVDITNPIRIQAGEGRIATDDIQVQLMPLPLQGQEDNTADASFSIGKIEILSV